MLPKSYKLSHGLCLNHFLQVRFICNQIYQVPPFRYVNRDDQVPHFVRESKVLGDMKYLISSVKQAEEVVGIWTEDNWSMKRVNSLYTMVYGRFNFKIDKRFDSFNQSLVVRYFYTRRGYIIGGLNEEQEQDWQALKKKMQTLFFPSGFSILLGY